MLEDKIKQLKNTQHYQGVSPQINGTHPLLFIIAKPLKNEL